MRITRFVPAGSVPVATGGGSGGGGAESSGRITFSGLRCNTGRSGSGSESALEVEGALRRVGTSLESELELEGALRRVGLLEYPPEFREELSTELPLNSMRALSATPMLRPLTPSSTRTVRAVPPRNGPLITRLLVMAPTL